MVLEHFPQPRGIGKARVAFYPVYQEQVAIGTREKLGRYEEKIKGVGLRTPV